MRPVYIVFILGLIGLYFVNAALKIDIFNWENFIHSGIRFFSGFIILGAGYFYSHKPELKFSLALVLSLFLADDILDYYRHVDSFSAEFILHGFYMLAWGSCLGYLTIRSIKRKTAEEN
jgi:hypothetical protein